MARDGDRRLAGAGFRGSSSEGLQLRRLRRPERKCARSATGLPVAPPWLPLWSPPFVAVPAMSRCTHG